MIAILRTPHTGEASKSTGAGGRPQWTVNIRAGSSYLSIARCRLQIAVDREEPNMM
ncbi:MAG: hypothetical protein WEA31_02855 [Pirellulales bacterium]